MNNGSFSIGRMLGRGGFGITYLGADLRLKRAVAIKEFFPAGSTRRGMSAIFSGVLNRADYDLAVQKFMQEAQMLARFQHRSIVNVYEVFQENDTAYMVMEYLQGEHLLERMERRGAPLGEAELVTITGPVVEALDEVHSAGVLHRDIKPENIMLVGIDDSPRPVLIDFGAAREFASGMANRHSIVLTPGYAPLEQYSEQARRGPFTDVYALAATLYHVATGQQPPAATERALGVMLKRPRELNTALSAAFDAALMHGLEMKVDQRPASATQFYRQMKTGQPGPSTTSPAPSTPSPPPHTKNPGAAPRSPVPAAGGSHFERVREIVRQIGQMGRIEKDRLVCPVCRNAEMFDSRLGTTRIRCPVCRVATLSDRVPASDRLLCPSCSRGELQPVTTMMGQIGVMMRCPNCQTGEVVGYAGSQMLFVPDLRAQCNVCGADFDYHSTTDSLTLEQLPRSPGKLNDKWIGQTRSRAEWAEMAGETADAYLCEVCDSAFQTCSDGTLEWVARSGDPNLVPREHRGQCRTKHEWAKIAHHLPDGTGSITCPHCAAQFDESASGELKLLGAAQDPHGMLAAHRGQTFPAETWLALAAGIRPPSGPVLACPNCSAYLAKTGREGVVSLAAYDLANDPYGTGQRYERQQLNVSDWRRIAAGGLPEREDRQLREQARAELWAAMRSGEISTSAAERSYPQVQRPGEKIVITFGVVTIRSRFGFFYEHDEGQIWLTTTQLYFRGDRGDTTLPLGKAGDCEVLDIGPAAERLVEIRESDGSDRLRFRMAAGPIEFEVEGVALELPWDEVAFCELFESLRRRI